MNKAASFTDEQLAKLRKYLEDEASGLANSDKISKKPYHPKKEHLRDYQWLIIDIENLGKVEMYFTGMTSHLKIEGIEVESTRVESFNFRQIHDILNNAYKTRVIEDSDQFFNAI